MTIKRFSMTTALWLSHGKRACIILGEIYSKISKELFDAKLLFNEYRYFIFFGLDLCPMSLLQTHGLIKMLYTIFIYTKTVEFSETCSRVFIATPVEERNKQFNLDLIMDRKNQTISLCMNSLSSSRVTMEYSKLPWLPHGCGDTNWQCQPT